MSLSTYFSPQYLALFLPIVILLMAVLPQKGRRLTLLLSSYFLFWCFSGKLIIYLLVSTFSIHHFGLWLSTLQKDTEIALKGLEKEEKKALKARAQLKQRNVMIFAGALHIGVLVALKYTPFFTENINSLFSWMGISYQMAIPRFAIPMGISFYTLQAMSYLFDVYRKTISADKNFMRLAMFMSFFPLIMEGPIVRYTDTADKLWNVERVRYNNFVYGAIRILFGFAKKIIVADRVN